MITFHLIYSSHSQIIAGNNLSSSYSKASQKVNNNNNSNFNNNNSNKSNNKNSNKHSCSASSSSVGSSYNHINININSNVNVNVNEDNESNTNDNNNNNNFIIRNNNENSNATNSINENNNTNTKLVQQQQQQLITPRNVMQSMNNACLQTNLNGQKLSTKTPTTKYIVQTNPNLSNINQQTSCVTTTSYRSNESVKIDRAQNYRTIQSPETRTLQPHSLNIGSETNNQSQSNFHVQQGSNIIEYNGNGMHS